MSGSPEHGGHAATRQSLLEAAADVFANVGFQNATIRDICQKAGANVAAVNYHFGDKSALYAEVLRVQGQLARQLFPIERELHPDAPAEERLKGFIRTFLNRVLSEELANRHGRMMTREMVEPTPALDPLVREVIQPQWDQLLEILRELLPDQTPEETLRMVGCSVVGQVLFYAHCRPVLGRLQPRDGFGFVEPDRLTDHITRFSLGAIRALGNAPANPTPRPAASRTRRPSASPQARRRLQSPPL